MTDSRRDFLKKAALLAGAAGLSEVLPGSIQRALAINPSAGSSWKDAEHVVILMQENRSFDHMLGTLRGVRGYNDPRAIHLPNRDLVWLQSNSAGQTYAPFRLDIHRTKATWMDSLPHSWSNQVNARNDGKYDQWLNVKRNSKPEYADMPLTMGYHTREDLPFYYALSDAFTICDQNFCSALTGTNPNRLYFWTGTVRAEQHDASRAHVWNEDMDYGTLNWATFPERLEAQGVSWKCYQNEVSIDTGFQGEEDRWLSNFQDNPLEFFAQYNIHLYRLHVDELRRKRKLAAQTGAAGAPAPDQLSPSAQTLDQLSPAAQALHRKAFDTNSGDPHYRKLEDLHYYDGKTPRSMKVPKGDVLHSFRADVRSGKLPAVSWLSAPENFSDHPSAPWYGAWYVSEVLDILTRDPEVWKKTILLVAYDENDGYFDHIPPFTAPHPYKEGTGKVSAGIDTRVDYVTLEQERERQGFPEPFERESSIGLGFRVPLIIASPWTRGGWVNSQVFDHTSTLQFLEKFLSYKTGREIKEPNISDWRRLVCGDLTSVFHRYSGDPVREPAFVQKDVFLESIHKAQFRKVPDDFKALSGAEIAAFNKAPRVSPYGTRQEPGTRHSCALPYSLLVDGRLSEDRKQFVIGFVNDNSIFGAATAGVPFNVCAPGQGGRTWAYGVKPGDTLTDAWPLADFEGGSYHLRVYGPNGFYREFRGNAANPGVTIGFSYPTAEERPSTADYVVWLHLENTGPACTLEMVDNAYGDKELERGLNTGDKFTMGLTFLKNHGWYDMSIRVKGYPGFEHRYAGRLEWGKPGISDPAMA
jgi:phospholipase C